MKKIIVKVLKLAGETGLRLPGSSYLEFEDTALRLQQRGIISIESDSLVKEEKDVIETKQEKFKTVPKTTKAKSKKK